MPGRGYNEDVAAYVDFLQEGVKKVKSEESEE
jgi:thiol:disulfide interchange protein DsbD